ncbi:hypothetical protein [Mesorhizobium sp.]|uniref:hypothetical protein n=1 Tax=Mesorhizobium sp. TaxID=1871066 RepID=UPI000FE4C057|nr:hypothetical protein [Mesorhizobium sp.]RWM10441.1 MAG: hypothetical protein EOR71_06695 [Mesorhizobium sp.]
MRFHLKDNLKSVLKSVWTYILIAIGLLLSGFFGHYGDRAASRLDDELSTKDQSVKMDFQAVMGCPSGRVADLRLSGVQLTNGANELTICDNEALLTSASLAAHDLALKYRGCLRLVGGDLTMLRVSHAICALPGSGGYVCDGAAGRNYEGAESMGVGQEVKPCSQVLLAKFGFR